MQARPSSQAFRGPKVQPVGVQASLVQASESEQAASTGVKVQPAPVQVLMVQATPSSQAALFGVATQVPA